MHISTTMTAWAGTTSMISIAKSRHQRFESAGCSPPICNTTATVARLHHQANDRASVHPHPGTRNPYKIMWRWTAFAFDTAMPDPSPETDSNTPASKTDLPPRTETTRPACTTIAVATTSHCCKLLIEEFPQQGSCSTDNILNSKYLSVISSSLLIFLTHR